MNGSPCSPTPCAHRAPSIASPATLTIWSSRVSLIGNDSNRACQHSQHAPERAPRRVLQRDYATHRAGQLREGCSTVSHVTRRGTRGSIILRNPGSIPSESRQSTEMKREILAPLTGYRLTDIEVALPPLGHRL